MDPLSNKYVKNFQKIWTIQQFLINKAEKHSIPAVENSNIDKSLGIIHSTISLYTRKLYSDEIEWKGMELSEKLEYGLT